MSSLVVTSSAPARSLHAPSARAQASASAGRPANCIHVRTPPRDLHRLRGTRGVDEAHGPPEALGDDRCRCRSIWPVQGDSSRPLVTLSTGTSGRSAPPSASRATTPVRVDRVDRPAPRRASASARRGARGEERCPSSRSLSRGCGSPRSHGSSIASSSHVPQRRTSCPRRARRIAIALPMYPAPRTVIRKVPAAALAGGSAPGEGRPWTVRPPRTTLGCLAQHRAPLRGLGRPSSGRCATGTTSCPCRPARPCATASGCSRSSRSAICAQATAAAARAVHQPAPQPAVLTFEQRDWERLQGFAAGVRHGTAAAGRGPLPGGVPPDRPTQPSLGVKGQPRLRQTLVAGQGVEQQAPRGRGGARRPAPRAPGARASSSSTTSATSARSSARCSTRWD